MFEDRDRERKGEGCGGGSMHVALKMGFRAVIDQGFKARAASFLSVPFLPVQWCFSLAENASVCINCLCMRALLLVMIMSSMG